MSIVGKIAGMYQKHVGKALSRYGLKYDDLLVETAEAQLALEWVPKEEQTARQRRIARAMDLSFKRVYLPDEIQNLQHPLDPYLKNHVEYATEMLAERKELTRW